MLSPEILICDEIGSDKEAAIISDAHFGGIVFLASLHGADVSDAFRHPAVKKLCDEGVFRYIALLERRGSTVSQTLYEYANGSVGRIPC